MYTLNETHDPNLRSWVASANEPDCDFPIQNLPFGVFRRRDGHNAPRVGVAIGDQIVDVSAALELFSGIGRDAARTCVAATLNRLMNLEPEAWSDLRLQLSRLLRDGNPNAEALRDYLVSMSEIEMLMPVAISDYTDFYASVFHATNVGSMFRPDNPLLPNYKYVPIGYHGRASSIVVSGTSVHRPSGQLKAPNADAPIFAPCRMLDYELELGVFVGRGNELGQPIALADAEHHMFGICILNDWSARDIQAWEYQPLGPFLAKNFISSISPWVVTLEALAPFRCAAFERPAADPAPLGYLSSMANEQHGGIDITLDVFLLTQKMREDGDQPYRLSSGNFRDMYWTLAQMLTHHASNGCNLRTGDLLGSGTISGAEQSSRGCLLELTWRGAEPIQLPNGEERTFLLEGDEVIMRGYCAGDGKTRIGLGECRGTIEK